MDWYIFRHGYTKESLYNVDYDKRRVFSAEILPEKRSVIEKLAQYLKNIPTDYNVSSPFLRCRQTVYIVSAITGKNFTLDDRLGEYNFQHNEQFSQLADRVKNFIDEINNKNFAAVAVCTHGGDISALKHWLIQGRFEPDDLKDYPIPGVLTVIKGRHLQEINFN